MNRSALVTEYRQILALLLFVSLFPVSSKVAQSGSGNSGAKSGEPNLELTAHGEARMLAGRRGVFRTYSAPDGTGGSFIAGQFPSLGDAKRQIDEWLKS